MKRIDNNNCYSEKEASFMKWGQDIRATMLKPLLLLLVKCRITADILTLLSLLSGLAGAIALYHSVPLGLSLILLHVIFDGIDGPLARMTQTDSNEGSFTDTMSDQLVIAAVGVVLIDLQIVSALAGLLYILSYTVVVGFAMVRNALAIPYSWLIRPRFMVYVWLPVEFYLLEGSLVYLLYLFSLMLIYKSITGFVRIKNTL
ncbi:MAG: CDP-alcohol phosphatidyltransferase family protein [Rickettsiales bacterium]|nr:CDP-alcohol phosphatidyltransferase family protein [Rickettsiales bacterium]